jgi:hypothetical protein
MQEGMPDELIEKALAERHRELAQWEQDVKEWTAEFKEREELKIAAQWWTDQLNKSGMTIEQVERFRQTLVTYHAEIMASNGGWFHWDINSRSWSYGNSYDHGLAEAGEAAGLASFEETSDPDDLQWRLPDALMHIEKGEVTVQIAGQEPQVLFPA